MVLLTSSAVSVMVSSGVVCMFTFLLFLCGYTLQQQTVRSLQEAIRRPPEPKPVPALPPQFHEQENENDTALGVGVLEQPGGAIADGNAPGEEEIESIHIEVIVPEQNNSPLNDAPNKRPPAPAEEESSSSSSSPSQRLAYMFALGEPSDLCSALLFAKQQRSESRLAAEPSIILLYPSTWESDPSPLHTSVLSFMRDVQDIHNLIYHPVRIYDAWDIKSQLLGELQWTRWEYDQALYLRSPGLILDGKALDRALATPADAATAAASSRLWAPLNPSSGNNPDVLLVTQQGLQSPKKEMRNLAVSADSILPESWSDDDLMVAEDLIKDAAYLVFEDGDLLDRRDDDDGVWYHDLVWKFNRGRKSVCAGSGLLESSLKSKLELKKRRNL